MANAYTFQVLDQNGFDSDLGRADAGCTIYLAEDGSIRNYGTPVWFDPDPGDGIADFAFQVETVQGPFRDLIQECFIF